MLGNMIQHGDDPDIVDPKRLLKCASYIMNKNTTQDRIHREGIFNIDNPFALFIMIDAMNNKTDILNQGKMLIPVDKAEFIRA